MPYHKTRSTIILVLSDGKPHSARDILSEARKLGITKKAAYEALFRCWKSGVVLRTSKPIFQRETVYRRALAFKVAHTRVFHMYVLNASAKSEGEIDGHSFVGYSKEFLDVRGRASRNNGSGCTSKARLIMDYIASEGKPLFAAEITGALKKRGIKAYDVSNTFRRYEKRVGCTSGGTTPTGEKGPSRRGSWSLSLTKRRKTVLSRSTGRSKRAARGWRKRWRLYPSFRR